MHRVTIQKNADYTGDNPDAFWNFMLGEHMGVGTTEQGFLFRMTDKMSRIIGIVRTGVTKVKDETIEDTLIDLANYCLLMAGYISDKKKNYGMGKKK